MMELQCLAAVPFSLFLNFDGLKAQKPRHFIALKSSRGHCMKFVHILVLLLSVMCFAVSVRANHVSTMKIRHRVRGGDLRAGRIGSSRRSRRRAWKCFSATIISFMSTKRKAAPVKWLCCNQMAWLSTAMGISQHVCWFLKAWTHLADHKWLVFVCAIPAWCQICVRYCLYVSCTTLIPVSLQISGGADRSTCPWAFSSNQEVSGVMLTSRSLGGARGRLQAELWGIRGDWLDGRWQLLGLTRALL